MSQIIKASRQLIRYVAAGGIAFLVDFATLILAVQSLHWHYLIGATLGFVVGSIVCYALSVRWVFDERRYGSRALEIGIFVGIGLVGLGLNNSVMWGLVEFAHVNYAVSKIVAAALIFLCNFAARRTILFSAGAPLPGFRRMPSADAAQCPTVAR